MALRKEIDGNKYDIRVLCTGVGDSDDAGYVEGVPIDPPDDKPGWMLVDLWVEHDTEQETVKADKDKGEKGKTLTRLVNPGFFQVWVRPKSPRKKDRSSKKKKTETAAPAVAAVGASKEPAEPKKKRGRQKKGAQVLNEDPLPTAPRLEGDAAEN